MGGAPALQAKSRDIPKPRGLYAVPLAPVPEFACLIEDLRSKAIVFGWLAFCCFCRGPREE